MGIRSLTLDTASNLLCGQCGDEHISPKFYDIHNHALPFTANLHRGDFPSLHSKGKRAQDTDVWLKNCVKNRKSDSFRFSCYFINLLD
jgi:hypothetical protein